MENLLSHVFGRVAFFAVVILMVAALIYWVGPLLSFAGYEPFREEWVRIAVIAGVVVIFGLFELWRYWRRRKKADAIQKGLSSAEEGAKEGQVLAKRLAEALATIRRMGGKSGKRDYLYSRPWYMIIGPPGTGKTTALENSGLKFLVTDNSGKPSLKGAGGTRNCDWFFTDDAILVDTAGRYTTQDSDAERDSKAWLSFLSLLRRNRPQQPLNGVIIAFGFDMLMNASAEDLRANADAVRRRLNELHKELGVRLPVYVWLTKADILPGFVEFFDDLSADGRREVLGATWKWDGAKPLNIDDLMTEFGLAVKALSERTPGRLQGEADAQRRSRVLGFPVQLAEARVRMATFFGHMFESRPLEPTPTFRGFYLTSGTQTGAAIDRLLGVMSQARVAPSAARGKSAGRAYFLQRVLSDVMFKEAGLVTADPRVRRRRRGLLIAGVLTMALLTAGLAAFWFIAYQRNSGVQDDLTAAVDPFLAERGRAGVDPNIVKTDQRGIEPIVASLDLLRALPGGYGQQNDEAILGDLGLAQDKTLAASAIAAYRQGLYRLLLPRLILRAEQVVSGEQEGDWRKLYEALRVYLQIGATPDGVVATGLRDSKSVREWYVREWQTADFPGAENRALRERLTGHLDALLEDPQGLLDAAGRIKSLTVGAAGEGPAVDWDLIKAAQETLASRSLEERALTAMEAEAAGRPAWVLKEKMLAGQERAFTTDLAAVTVPFLYTKEGFESIYLAFSNDALSRIQDEQWVLGAAGSADAVNVQATVLRRNLANTYAAAYTDRWVEVLGSAKPLGLKSVSDAVELTKKPQPISRFLGAVVAETQLVGPDQLSGDASGQAGAIITRRFAELSLYVNGPGEDVPGDIRRLEDALEAVRKAMEGGGGGGGGAALEQATQQLAAAVQSMPGDAAAIGGGLTESAGDTAAATTRSALANEYREKVLPACQAITKFYPFAARGADASVQDFAAAFGPGGTLRQFLETRLAPYVDTSGKDWKPRAGDPVGRTLSSRSIGALQLAGNVSRALFRSPYGPPGASVGFRVVVTATALGPGVQSARLTLGPTQAVDLAAVGSSGALEWIPGPGMDVASLVITPRDGAPPLTLRPANGAFALFRLFDSGECRPCTVKNRVFTFGSGATAVTVNVKVDGAETFGDPFDKANHWNFKCPSAL